MLKTEIVVEMMSSIIAIAEISLSMVVKTVVCYGRAGLLPIVGVASDHVAVL